ncbi:hypothetical protein G6F65_021431 [Rhizopus arrhizus]|nr:hypothetical protein G6F65_021431 [Rhizopus arrhizus]
MNLAGNRLQVIDVPALRKRLATIGTLAVEHGEDAGALGFADSHHASFRWDCWAMAARSRRSISARMRAPAFTNSRRRWPGFHQAGSQGQNSGGSGIS